MAEARLLSGNGLMADTYGFSDRPDEPTRIINVPPQAAARNTLPRALDAAIKNPQTSGVIFRQLQYSKMCDASRLLAAVNLDATASGGGGGVTNTNQAWYSRVGRFCRTSAFRHNSGTTFGFSEERVGFDFSLYALMAAAAQPGMFVLRFEDVLAAEMSVASGTVSGCFQFGLRQNSTAPGANAPDSPFIGFHATAVATGYPTWHYTVVGDGGASPTDGSTGFTTEHPHRLTCDVDASTGTATFFVDGTQIAQVTGVTNTFTHTTDNGGLSWVIGGTGSGTHDGTFTAGYWMDLQANLWVRVLDEVV